MSNEATAFERAYYKQLVGAKITAMGFQDVGFGQLAPRIIATLKDGTRVELLVLADAEGNGGGFIDGLPDAKQEPK